MLSAYDEHNIGSLLAGEGTWFNAHLLRLIAKADNSNMEKLRKGFPEEVKAVEEYRQEGPIWVDYDHGRNN
jgi:hypothetical protein